MFCPECRSEFREGFTRCAECDVELVPSLPSPDGDPDAALVRVLETSDPALIAVLKTVLEDAGIEFMTQNEAMQDMIGGGRLAGLNPVLGPVEFWVRENDESAARELINEAADSASLAEFDAGTDEE